MRLSYSLFDHKDGKETFNLSCAQFARCILVGKTMQEKDADPKALIFDIIILKNIIPLNS